MSLKQWEHTRDEPDLPQRKGRRAASSNIHRVFARLIDYKRCIKHIGNASDNKSECTTNESKKEWKCVHNSQGKRNEHGRR